MLYLLFLLSEELAALSQGTSVRAAGGRAPDTVLELGVFFVGCILTGGGVYPCTNAERVEGLWDEPQ